MACRKLGVEGIRTNAKPAKPGVQMSTAEPAPSTLTHRFAAIQIKMWHLQFRMRQVLRNHSILNEQEFSSNRQRIRGLGPAIYSVLDMLVTFEHLEVLMSDILATDEIRSALTPQEVKNIGRTKNVAARWKSVRNVFGGHIDLSIVVDVCERHNFRGALLSNDLETDIAVYNALLLEGALNRARVKSDIFGRDLNFSRDLSGEISIVIEELNKDWNEVFAYFEPLMKRIYEVGKPEKMAVTRPEDRLGLVIGD